MSVVASDLLAAAQKACIHADCEADWRGVLSRSYYAIYQDGLAFHNSLPVPGSLNPVSTGGIHEDLIEFLKNPGVPKASAEYSRSRRVGIIMAALHTSRVKADYKRDILIPSEDAANSLANAEAFIWRRNPSSACGIVSSRGWKSSSHNAKQWTPDVD
jgi:hypothetical protein